MPCSGCSVLHGVNPKEYIYIYIYIGETTQLKFYVLLKSQEQAGPFLQVLPDFLTSKSLFWCNPPLTTLSEYSLDFRLLLCILLYPFSLIFHYFAIFFFFNHNHHFFFNYLIPPAPCSCFFFGFHWFYAFLFALPPHPRFLLDLHLFFIFLLLSFWTFFLWFSCSFLLSNACSLDFLLLVDLTFFLGYCLLHLCS